MVTAPLHGTTQWRVLYHSIDPRTFLLSTLHRFFYSFNTSCGSLCTPKPACTYCKNEPRVYFVTTIISPNLVQILFYLAYTLPSVCTLWKLFQYFTRRKWWFFGDFLQHCTPPPKFCSFSHVAKLRAYVLAQITPDVPEPICITETLSLTVKRINEYRCKVLSKKVHGSMELWQCLSVRRWLRGWVDVENQFPTN